MGLFWNWNGMEYLKIAIGFWRKQSKIRYVPTGAMVKSWREWYLGMVIPPWKRGIVMANTQGFPNNYIIVEWPHPCSDHGTYCIYIYIYMLMFWMFQYGWYYGKFTMYLGEGHNDPLRRWLQMMVTLGLLPKDSCPVGELFWLSQVGNI